jgi:tetratricopeptide (TPR) repeat protein
MQSLLIPLADWLWRGLALLWLAFAPYAAKVEIASARSVTEAAIYVAVALALLAGFAYGVSRLAARSRVGAALAVFALLEALVLGHVFSAERGPLGRALIWVFPVVWGAIAFNAAWPLADLAARSQGRELPARRERAGWAVAALLFGLLGLAASYRRLSSPEALLAAAVRSDPGSEVLALREAQIQKRAHDDRGAEATLGSCLLANPDACGCAVPLLEAALERGAYDEAGAVLVRVTPSCRERPRVSGMLAEALAGGGDPNAARQAADIALAKDRGDPHALYAKALLALHASDTSLARRLLEQAIEAGRGGRARVDLGALLFKAGDLARARQLFEATLRENPNDVPALYDLALVDQTENRYHAAREGYLKVLRLEPRHLDARYNLAVLTNGVGAHSEAQHHVEEFAKTAPAGDARTAALKELVQ